MFHFYIPIVAIPINVNSLTTQLLRAQTSYSFSNRFTLIIYFTLIMETGTKIAKQHLLLIKYRLPINNVFHFFSRISYLRVS